MREQSQSAVADVQTMKTVHAMAAVKKASSQIADLEKIVA